MDGVPFVNAIQAALIDLRGGWKKGKSLPASPLRGRREVAGYETHGRVYFAGRRAGRALTRSRPGNLSVRDQSVPGPRISGDHLC
jgi:hypothetical protein